MKCDMKTMIKAALLSCRHRCRLYNLPAARDWIISSAPFSFSCCALLMMLFMMMSMQSYNKEHLKMIQPLETPLSHYSSTVDAYRSLFNPK